MKIKGLGPYTIGAILNFGFYQKAAAVDGNVARVISRYFAIAENICKTAARRKIEEKTVALLDEKQPWVTSEALIELGATVCLPKPRCEQCPLQLRCLAFKRGIAHALPIKNKETSTTLLTRVVVVIEAAGSILIRKEKPGKVMADLYEFPYFAEKDPSLGRVRHMIRKKEKLFGMDLKYVQFLGEVTHTFTRYKARLFPYLLKATDPIPVDGSIWMSRDCLQELPFSAGHRKILHRI